MLLKIVIRVDHGDDDGMMMMVMMEDDELHDGDNDPYRNHVVSL